MKKIMIGLLFLSGLVNFSDAAKLPSIFPQADAAKFPLSFPQIYSFSGRFTYIFETCLPENKDIPNATKKRIHASLKGQSLPDLRCLTFDLVEELSERLEMLDNDMTNKVVQRDVVCALKKLRIQIPNPKDGFEEKIPFTRYTSFEWHKFKFASLTALRTFKTQCGNMRRELWRLAKEIEKISI